MSVFLYQSRAIIVLFMYINTEKNEIASILLTRSTSNSNSVKHKNINIIHSNISSALLINTLTCLQMF